MLSPHNAIGSFSDKVDRSLLWSFKAIALSKLKRYDEALEAIEKAIEYNDKSGFNWSLKGDIHHDPDEQDEALKAY